MLFTLTIFACLGAGISNDNCRYYTADHPTLSSCLAAKEQAYTYFRAEGRRVTVQCVPLAQTVAR